ESAVSTWASVPTATRCNHEPSPASRSPLAASLGTLALCSVPALSLPCQVGPLGCAMTCSLGHLEGRRPLAITQLGRVLARLVVHEVAALDQHVRALLEHAAVGIQQPARAGARDGRRVHGQTAAAPDGWEGQDE